MAGRKITVEFLGDSKDLQNAIGDVDGKSSRLSGTLKKVGKAAALGLGAGLVVGAAALVKMTKGAAEDEAAQAKLAGVLKNTTGATDKQVASVESWISAQGKALGVTDDELRPALEKLAASTGSVKEAQKQASVAMDVAAGRGLSLETVAKAMERANNGNVTSLGKLGIETKNAAGETISMEQAQKRLADTYGGAASTKAETLQGKMDRLKVILAETGETIGAKVIPMVTTMADWFLNKGLPAIQAFGGWLGDHMPPIFEKVRSVISAVMGGMQGDVGGKFEAIRGIFENVTSIIMTLWDTFGATILDYATKTFENMKQILGGALDVIAGIFKTFSALLKGDWSGVWDGIKQILSGAWEIIKGVVKQQLNIMSTIFEAAWAALKGIVSGAWDGIKTVVSNGIGKIVDFVQAIPGKFIDALSGLNVAIATLFRDAMIAGKEKVIGVAGDIKDWVAGIPDKLASLGGAFSAAGRSLLQGFIDGMKNAAGVIEGIAGNVWDSVKGLLNGAIAKINSALEFTIKIPGAPDLSINPPNIPALAKGGLVTRPTLALIGEDGPEAVVPLSRKHNPGGAMPGMGGGSDRPLIIQLVTPYGKVIEEVLVRHSRDTGRPLAFTTSG